MMDRAVAGANGESVGDGGGDVLLGEDNGGRDFIPSSQISGDSSRKRAARAVGVFGADARRVERSEFFAVVK